MHPLVAVTPTPVHPLPRLAKAIGLGEDQLWVKREDLTGLAAGGNKARKLSPFRFRGSFCRVPVVSDRRRPAEQSRQDDSCRGGDERARLRPGPAPPGNRRPVRQSAAGPDARGADPLLLLDPVYTGKAMAGLIAQARDGRIGREQRVVFVHTGGLPGLLSSGYTSWMAQALGSQG